MTLPPLHRIAPSSALRSPTTATPRVTNMELFFDLVYVFTIIQLSHFLLEHASLLGVVEFAILFAAVWWAWNYTAWATNWIDPDHVAGRVLMVALMACALLMAIAMPKAFSERAGLFAAVYVVMGVGRAFYMAAVFRGQTMGGNYAQLGAWSALAGVFWIAGALSAANRVWLWGIAVLIDLGGPYAGFWLPGRGATPMSTWPLRGLHLLERNQQIFIIALGESILLLGGVLVGEALSAGTLAAAGLGFLTIVALWWIYFLQTTTEGEHAFERAETDHSAMARAGLAYAHGVMVAGAIVVAVAIERILAHPLDAVHLASVLCATVGPAIFLAGSALFRRVMSQRVPLGYVGAAAALAVWGVVAGALHVPGLVLGAGSLAILAATAFTASGGEAHAEAEA